MRVLAAPDKFKGTASAPDVAAAMVRAAHALGHDVRALPLSDGGDGLLDAFGGADRHTRVTGPHGAPVDAGWRLDGASAVLESALASGLVLAGRAEGNDPVRATSRGTGELIDHAVSAGAMSVLVGVGGSASTDGGLPAVDALSSRTLELVRGGAVTLTVCCDVRTRYLDAATVFAPQKGATPEQVDLLTARLAGARDALRDRFGVDVQDVDGSGAAGGLAGALLAAGALLRDGFAEVATHVGLREAVRNADLVLTGEGRLDETSFAGKVVGGVVALSGELGTTTVAVVGDRDDGVASPIEVVSLVERYGRGPALQDVSGCVERATRDVLLSPRRAE